MSIIHGVWGFLLELSASAAAVISTVVLLINNEKARRAVARFFDKKLPGWWKQIKWPKIIIRQWQSIILSKFLRYLFMAIAAFFCSRLLLLMEDWHLGILCMFAAGIWFYNWRIEQRLKAAD